MRDERKFDDADIFNITRLPDQIPPYFGDAIHRCLGIQIMRSEIKLALEAHFVRFPNLEVFPERASSLRSYGRLGKTPEKLRLCKYTSEAEGACINASTAVPSNIIQF